MPTEVMLYGLGIIGTFLGIALCVNAFFLRGIFQDLNTVKIQMATMFERSDSKEKRIEESEINIKEIFARLNEVEKKI